MIISNPYPNFVYLYLNGKFEKKIKPKSSLNFSNVEIGDIIHITVIVNDCESRGQCDRTPQSTGNDSQFQPRAEVLFSVPFRVIDTCSNISLGAATYRSVGGSRETTTSASDLSGVYLYNKSYMPFDIYYNGVPAAKIGGYDGKGYHGGSKGILYFSNSREGLKLGDTIGLYYANTDIHILDFLIQDIQAQHININAIDNDHFEPHIPDNITYRFGTIDQHNDIENYMRYTNGNGEGSVPEGALYSARANGDIRVVVNNDRSAY